MKVRDLFDLNIMKNFRLVAGAGGLDRTILGTEIMAIEFIQGVKMNRDHIFEEKKVILSSLIFAKDNPDLIYNAVKRLNEMNVSCFAYKTVFIKELPEKVLRYADDHDFPILQFGGDEFFEEVLLQILAEVNRGTNLEEIERNLEIIMRNEMGAEDELKFSKSLNPNFKEYVRAVYICDREYDEDSTHEKIVSLIKHHVESEKLRRKSAMAKFRKGYFIFLSQDEPDERRFSAQLEDIFIQLGIEHARVRIGFGIVRRTEGNFGKAVREAFWAGSIAQMEATDFKKYDELGVYRFLIPTMYSVNTKERMEEYLKPLLEDANADLLETAVAYIQCHGDVEETAKKMICHKNTIRYRMSRVQEILDAEGADKDFYESLFIAVRLYLLNKYK